MATLVAQRLSRTLYEADGITTSWNFTFSGGYLDHSHVKASVLPPGGTATPLTITAANFIGDYQLSITPPVAAGTILTIYRDTPKDLPIVDFTDGAGLTEIALDTNAKQAVFIAAESADAIGTADVDLAIIAADEAQAASAAAVTANAEAQLALNSLRGYDTIVRFSGDGVDTTWPLVVPAGTVTPAVYIGGIYQQTNTYTIAGGVLTFSSPPVAGTNNIEVVLHVALPTDEFTPLAEAAAASAAAAAVSALNAADASRLSVGTVTTGAAGSSAAVSITGPSGAQVLNMTVPTGPAGADGTYAANALQASLAATGGAAMVGYTPSGAGAAVRTVAAKLREVVSVLDFGAVGDGVADDAAAIQAALDTGRAVFLPVGVYKLASPVTLATVGQRMFGESAHNTYLTGGLNHDQVRIAASHCELSHLHFRPAGYSDAAPAAFAPVRVYAALAHLHDNRFLAAAAGHGTAILCDDVNPVTSAVVAGAYLHTISENRIGASGYDFKYGVFCFNANNGMQGAKFQNNQVLGDSAFYTYYGGGNYYVGNVLQSATGGYAPGTRVGIAIDLQAAVIGETITGNYIERYNYGAIVRRVAQDYMVANIYGNHWDNNGANIYSVGSPLIAYFDETSWYEYRNTWQWRYNSQDDLKLINREGVEVLNINRAAHAVEPRVLSHNLVQSLTYAADGATSTPVSSWCEITGGGAPRTGCYLGNGARPGQHLYLRAHSWSVQLLNNPGGTQNIVFAGGAASATFGQSGNVGTMHLMWDPAYGTGRWFEISRTLA